MRECEGRDYGWRVDEFGNWWPCAKTLGPILTREGWEEKKRKAAQEAEVVITEAESA